MRTMSAGSAYANLVPLAPIKSAEEYAVEARRFIEYFAPTPRAAAWRSALLLRWMKAVDFERHLRGLRSDPSEVDAFYETRDGMAMFRESLASMSAAVALEDDPMGLAPATRAAALAASAVDFLRRLRVGAVQPDEIAGQVQDMSQFFNIYGTHAMPGGSQDQVEHTTAMGSIIVGCCGRLHELRLSGTDVSSDFAGIRAALGGLRSPGERSARGEWGWGTAARRPTWAKIRRQLLRDPSNERSLAAIRRASFLLVIDEHEPSSVAETLRLAQSGNAGERWYDFGLQLIVFANGRAAMVFNHRNNIDGNIMARHASEVQSGARSLSRAEPPQTAACSLHSLPLELSGSQLALAREDARKFMSSDPYFLSLDGYGRRFFREHESGGDAGFQVALHAACTTLLGRVPNIMSWAAVRHHKDVGLNLALTTTEPMRRMARQLAGVDALAGGGELMDRVIQQHRQVIADSRQGMPLYQVMHHYMTRAKPAQRAVLLLVLVAMGITRFKFDAIVSNPRMFPGVAAFGRAGAVLPYLRLFGMHYQIHEERVDVVLSPGCDWKVERQAFEEALRSALVQFGRVRSAANVESVAGGPNESVVHA
jgi:hypothetical protein